MSEPKAVACAELRVDLQLFLLEENGEKLVVQLTIKLILIKEDKECVT